MLIRIRFNGREATLEKGNFVQSANLRAIPSFFDTAFLNHTIILHPATLTSESDREQLGTALENGARLPAG